MRPHGRHYKRSQGNKGQDDEHYLGAQVDDIRSETYPRLHESSRHSESYRASSSSNRSSYDAGGASTSRSQRHSDSWRHGDLEEGRHGFVANDGYHRQSGGREEHDILDTRDPEGWSSRDARYNGSRSDWSQRYDYGYPPSSYAESSSRNPPIPSSHDNRAASFDHWPLEDSRIDDRVMLAPDDRHLDSNWRHQPHRDKGSQKFQSDSGWDTQRRSKAWDEPPATWDVAAHEKDHRVVNERSWDPAPGWQPSGHGGHAQGNRHGQRTSTSTRNSITSSNANTNHKGSKRSAYSNKPKRDWRNDDSTLNNWQKREVHASSERTTKPPPRRKHPRSSSRSRSRSPVGSYYSRRSSWDRSQSRSVSPVPKRRRRGASPPAPSSRSPSDRGRPSRAVDPHHDKAYSPYSPRSPRRSPPGYHSPRDKGRTPLPPHPRHDRDLSPLSPTSPANYASHTSGERGRAILRPNARYAKEQTPSPKRSPASYPRRQRSISSVSSVSSERSPSHSPPGRARAVHRLPSINANSSLSPTVPLRATGTTPRKSGHQRNGKGQTNGKHNNGDRRKNASSGQTLRMDSMPPPSVIPPPHGLHASYARESHPPPQYSQPVQPASYIPHGLPPILPDLPPPTSRFAPMKHAGFKPINQTSSSLKKFFPGEDEEMENFMEDLRVRSASGRHLDEETYERTRPTPYQSIRPVPLHHERKTWPSPPAALSPRRLDHDDSGQYLAQTPASSVQADFRKLSSEEPDARRPTASNLPVVENMPDIASVDVPSTPSDSRGELYKIISQVGEGTFGKVYKAQNTITRVHVALKRIRMESEKDGFPVTAMREIKLLQSLQHPNIVRLYEMMVSNGSVYMVFEYMDHDLTGVLSQTQFSFTDAHLKSLCHQMLAGLAYLHHKGVIHRDIKGSNILINNRGELKLGDFGLARFYQKRRRTDYTNRVITLWYRPPELLFGATVYGPEVDMWSAGCIMLELFTKKPVFQGNDEIHQLDVVYKIIGTPTPERWAGVMDLPWYELVKPRETIPNRFRDLFQKWMSPAALDLAERLLAYDPSQRVTALQAMDASYFTQEEPRAALPAGLATLKGEWHELETKRERAKKKKKSESAATENHDM